MTYYKRLISQIFGAVAVLMLVACSSDNNPPEMEPVDPATADRVSVDRFSTEAGNLFVRDDNNGLPEANAAINFDVAPFITKGLGPNGELVEYYNFDVMPSAPAPIFVLFREGSDAPVDGQLNIIDVIPGDAGYNDFWHVQRVTVPADYVANTVTSYAEIMSLEFVVESTDILVNCPVVPDGSTASKRIGGGSVDLVEGWYQGMVVSYFAFGEKALSTTPTDPNVALSPIYVSFNINPDQEGGGPASGFASEGTNMQTHNVIATLPEDDDYSPYWFVNVYDNADFYTVSDIPSAMAANLLGEGVATVNCPVVSVDDAITPARVVVDRFSAEAGNLFVRNDTNGLPAANMPIDFDAAPFITQGFGPLGGVVEYYNFDVMSTTPAPIYVLFNEETDTPIVGQMNILDVIPGDEGYSDFWHVQKVMVPADYVTNSVTSFADIEAAGFTIQATDILVNCPVVPAGSTALKRFGGGSADLIDGWYKGLRVSYFAFGEHSLSVEPANPVIALSPIYVSFNINPNETDGGPASGFMTEADSMQTHNVLASIPQDDAYSPLWMVNVYNNADFDSVTDFESATTAEILGEGVATVNCPVVTVESAPPTDPATAERVEVDRFSAAAGNLFVRTGTNGLPAANSAIDFDVVPFITQGLSANGGAVEYYNFDVMPATPAPIYVLFHEGEESPVPGQLNIIDVIPGDEGYNDFWHVQKVTVPANYVANSVTSYSEIMARGYTIEATETLVNCPVVPDGSTASKRIGGGSSDLVEGWYQGQVVSYFSFNEKALSTSAMNPSVALSPIYVMFNINPDQEGGGPASGFATETSSSQTHNVVATIPSDENYSPFWFVNVVDNADFDTVLDLPSAMAANVLAEGVATVNCPVVEVPVPVQ